MSIKIVQIGNNLNIVFENKSFTISNKEINEEVFWKYAFKYNQQPSEYVKNKLERIFKPFLEKKDFEKENNKIESKKIKNQIKKLKTEMSWSFKSNRYFIKDFNIPTEFVNYIKKAIENNEDISVYKNFINKLANNPIVHVRDNFFSYMNNCNLKLTPSGNIIAYRYVKSLDDYDLNDAKLINELYIKAKVNKKSPSNYKFKNITVQEAYDSLNIIFTDSYTKKQQYQLNSIITMPLNEADTSTSKCSKGFHFTNYEGINQIKGYDFGDMMIVGLINPANIVSIPNDNYPKFRCIEWYFAAIIDNNIAQEIENSDISIFDMDFETKSFEKVNDSDPFNLKKKQQETKEKIREYKKSLITNKKTPIIISKL